MGKGSKKGSSPASKGTAPAAPAYLTSDDAYKLLSSGNLSQLKSLLKQHLDPMQMIECQELVCTFHEPATTQYPLLLAAANLTNSKMFELLLKAPGADVNAAVSPSGFNCVFAIVSNQNSSGLDKLSALKMLENRGFTDWNKVVSFGKYRITVASMLCFSNQQHKPEPDEDEELPSRHTSNGTSALHRVAGGSVYSNEDDDDVSCSSDSSSDSGGSTISQEAIRQKMPQDREREMFEYLLDRGLLRWPMEADALVDAFYQLLIMGRARPYIGRMLQTPAYQPGTPGYDKLVHTMLVHWGSNKLCKKSTPLLERLKLLLDSTPAGRGEKGQPLPLTCFSYLISTVLKSMPPRVELVEELLKRGLEPRMKLNVDLTASSDDEEYEEQSRCQSSSNRPTSSQVMTLTLPQLYSLKTYRDMSQAQKVVVLLLKFGADAMATSSGRDMGPKPVTAYDLAAQGGSHNKMSDLLFAAMKAAQEAKAEGMDVAQTATHVSQSAEESRRSYNKRLRHQQLMGTSLGGLPPMGASFRSLMQPGAIPFSSPVLPPGAVSLLERAEQCLLQQPQRHPASSPSSQLLPSQGSCVVSSSSSRYTSLPRSNMPSSADISASLYPPSGANGVNTLSGVGVNGIRQSAKWGRSQAPNPAEAISALKLG